MLQAQGFHGEIEDMQQWLKDTERQLLASKAVGGLPDTAREQLNAHLVRLLKNMKDGVQMARHGGRASAACSVFVFMFVFTVRVAMTDHTQNKTRSC